MGEKKPDFSGWATKAGIRCTDGRTIKPGCFKHQDKAKVPLVWQHQHKEPDNVLGHAILEDRAFGTYTYGFLNETPKAKHIKTAIEHGDIDSLSIFAVNLTEKKLLNGDKEVFHGDIREVSICLAGANEGAVIDNIYIMHGDDLEMVADEAIIYTGLTLEHQDMTEGENTMPDEKIEHAETKDKTVAEVFAELTEDQKNVVYYLVGQAMGAEEGDELEQAEELDGDAVLAHIDTQIENGFKEMTNVFEQQGTKSTGGSTLTHDQFATLMEDAKKLGSFKEGVAAHAGDYGIDNIELLFPDAQAVENNPAFVSRRLEWVDKVLKGTKHVPFAKIKSLFADITADEARAKGYIKGNEKKEEVFPILKRTTSPTTIYKKQKLDRDDIVDITSLDVVAWLKAEMRLMIEEEIARAILIGDGRSVMSPDKIKDPAGATDGNGIRSIINDNDFYAHKVSLEPNTAVKQVVKELVRARTNYRGSGKPTLFISENYLTDIMLEEDKFERPLYPTEQSLADKVRASEIVPVDLFDNDETLFAIMVNLNDYYIGATKGGELTSFEDFDIDFNQYKYLIETRLSGALVKYKSAVVVRRLEGTQASPTAPSFNGATNTITIPTTTGVDYQIDGENVTGSVIITENTTVSAVPKTGYYFASNITRDWGFTYTE